MRNAPMTGLRIAGLMLLAIAIAHCGGNDVHITTERGVQPSRGTFTGTTSEGDPIIIEVGSIEAISFECDGESIQETFDPPRPVNNDGTFDVSFVDGGRKFRVTGQFPDNDTVQGDINDADNRCDDSFDGVRSGVTPPTRTPTPVSTGTTPIATPTIPPTTTPIATGPTSIATGPTSIATGPTPTATGPTPTATGPTPCPSKLTLEGQGSQADLDSGFTGIAFNQEVINKGTITVDLACPGQPGSCGNCTVNGPVASTTSVDNERCTDDTSVTCDAQTPCPAGKGQCAFFFGSPLPLSSGGVPACVVNRVNGTITGTANPDTGSGASQVALISSIFTNGVIDRPCPTCTGATFGSTGTCTAGPRTGQACTVDGTSTEFGNTSFDCPPGKPSDSNGNLDIALNPTTGTTQLQPTNTCLNPGFAGKPCYCPQQPKPNDCTDGICTVSGETGTCEAGPADRQCTQEPFRGCLSNADCPKPGDTCGNPTLRPCSGQTEDQGNGIATTGNLTRTGTANKNNPVLVSTFCVPITSASAVNTAAGLPGPGALRLPNKACYSSTSCTFP